MNSDQRKDYKVEPMNESKPYKTVFILASGVPGDQCVEPMGVYYKGNVPTTYEMTFDPGEAKRFPTRVKAAAFRDALDGSHRFTIVEHAV
jgi:hypothetical protein